MSVCITFRTCNAAFQDGGHEAVRVIREVAEKIERGHFEGKVYDHNGNVVGMYSFFPEYR